ncbi:hypothetical protein SD415_13750 [Citrobacter braakii]|uniref:hypothetical protein n=1 Tax=Citrobacter braakii TaxID=57706 RepID=UPI0030CFE462
MSKTFAVIENETVVNVIIWDGMSSMACGGNQSYIQIAQSGVGSSAPLPGIGWSFKNGKFTPPPAQEPSPDEMAARNIASAQSAYDAATRTINALNEQIEDADYTGTTESSVNAELVAWVAYRVSLRTYIRVGDGSQIPPTPPQLAR